MNDARAHLSADAGKLLEMVQERVDQGSTIALIFGRTRAGMHHHACRFVDDGEIVVFIGDVQGNILSNRAQRRTPGGVEYSHVLPATPLDRRICGRRVWHTSIFEDTLLHPRSTRVRW